MNRFAKILILAFSLCALLTAFHTSNFASAGPAGGADPEGKVRLFKIANSAFDTYTNSPTPAQQAWMQKKYWRMLTFSPYFDSRLSWFPNAWFYKDIYALYVDENVATQHPDWVLKDSQGHNLFIPWGCANGTCPQYAADVGNADFRAYWLAQAQATMSQGYRGMWIDDVNLDWRVGDGNGNFVDPIDPRTSQPMTRDNWQKYFVEFTEQIYASFPDNEIAHNAIWFADDVHNQYVQREIDSTDWINLERGINDDGLTGGGGAYGIDTLFAYIDEVHAHNKSVIFEASANTKKGREFGLAGWLLINNGWDALANDPKWTTPSDWWKGYDLNLGAAKGPHYLWKNVYRRNFAGGIVLLNPPDAPKRILKLNKPYRTFDGALVSQVTLKAKQGIVLLK